MKYLLSIILMIANIIATESLNKLENNYKNTLNKSSNGYFTNERLEIWANIESINQGFKKIEEYGKFFKQILLHKLDEQDIIKILKKYLEYSNNPIELKLNNSIISSDYISDIIKCINNLNIFSLTLENVLINSENEYISDFFINNLNLQKLELRRCNLKLKDIECISEILNNNLTSLISLIIFDDINDSNIILNQLISNIKNNKKLEILYIFYKKDKINKIISKCACDAFKSFKALKELEIWDIDDSKDDQWKYSCIIDLEKNIKTFKLFLSNEKLLIKDRTRILNAIADYYELDGYKIKLYLSENFLKYIDNDIKNKYLTAKERVWMKSLIKKRI